MTSIQELFVQLGTLRANVLQDHLQKCRSIKVKRLFLFLARESGHGWYKKLNRSRVKLGSGKRSIEPGGVYDSEFEITVARRESEKI
jgi:hypothetical protein